MSSSLSEGTITDMATYMARTLMRCLYINGLVQVKAPRVGSWSCGCVRMYKSVDLVEVGVGASACIEWEL